VVEGLNSLKEFDKIILCTVPRTGSTLIYRILKELYKDMVIEKGHSFEKYFDHNGPFVLTYRDPIDVFCSFWRIDSILGNWQENVISDWEVVRICARVVFEFKRFNVFVQKQVVLKNNPNLLFLKYEDFWDDYDVIYDKLSSFFDIKITPRRRKELTNKCSIKSVLEIQKNFDDFLDVDEKSGIHGDHVGFPEPNEWWNKKKHDLSSVVIGYIESKLNDIRWNYGYRQISSDDYIQVLLTHEVRERMMMLETGGIDYIKDILRDET